LLSIELLHCEEAETCCARAGRMKSNHKLTPDRLIYAGVIQMAKKRVKAAPKKTSAKKRQNRRVAEPVILSLHQDLDVNEQHPLANMDASRRGVDRQYLIASILARLADRRSSIQVDTGTIADK